MKVVYKYVLEDNPWTVRMPKGAQVLSAHAQHNKPCVWALVDDEETVMERHEFFLFATGRPLPESFNLTFIGTVLLYNGNLVFHIFE